MSDDYRSAEGAFQVASGELIGAFFVMMRVALIHRMDNEATGPAVARFLASLSTFGRDVGKTAALQFVGDAVYVNRRLVHTDLESWKRARFLEEFFAKMNLAEIEYRVDVPETSLRGFVQAVRDITLEPEREEQLHRRIFTGIRFRDLSAEGAGLLDTLALPDRLRVLRAYGLLVVTLRELCRCVASGAEPRILPLRRAVQELMWLPKRTEGLTLALLAVPDLREELPGRLAHVALTTLAMARRLGLPRPEVREIAVTAALAGIGRALSPELAHADLAELVEADAARLGLARLLEAANLGRHAALRIITGMDASTEQGRRFGHPLARLISAADAYERNTLPPPHGPGLPPEQALTALLRDPNIDASAARLLATTLGVFPPGSLVRLSSGETAVVDSAPRDACQLFAPRVMVVMDQAGELAEPRQLDLAASPLTITGSVDPAPMRTNPTHFLFRSA